MTWLKKNIAFSIRLFQDSATLYGAKRHPVFVRPDGAGTLDSVTICREGNIKNECIIHHGEDSHDVSDAAIIQRYYNALNRRGWMESAHNGVLDDTPENNKESKREIKN